MTTPHISKQPPTQNEDEVLRRMLATPHKPHADKPAPAKKSPKDKEKKRVA